jgi:hypothetical protein
MWVLVLLVIFTTLAITFGTLDSRGQQVACEQTQPTPTTANRFGDLNKYPKVIYDGVESLTAAERVVKQRRLHHDSKS